MSFFSLLRALISPLIKAMYQNVNFSFCENVEKSQETLVVLNLMGIFIIINSFQSRYTETKIAILTCGV